MKIVIKGNPVTKKNSQRIVYARGHAMILPSKRYKEYEAKAMLYMPRLKEPINERVNLKCIYYMQTHRIVDLPNLIEATCDIFVKYGVLKDDNSNIASGFDGSDVRYDKENPRAEIEITRKEQ